MTDGRFVVYTALFGDYDYLAVPRFSEQRVPALCFTDRPQNVPAGWTPVMMSGAELSPDLLNRRLKLFPHEYLQEYELSLYVDANVALRADPAPLARERLARSNIAIPRHPLRNCVYDEISACVVEGKLSPAEGEGLVQRYQEAGMPPRWGLTENFFILRRHHEAEVMELAEKWWQALSAGPRRDQLHLPFVSWQNGLEVAVMDESVLDLRWLLRRFPHRPRHGPLQRMYYETLSRNFSSPLGRALEGVLGLYNRAKGVQL